MMARSDAETLVILGTLVHFRHFPGYPDEIRFNTTFPIGVHQISDIQINIILTFLVNLDL